MKLTKRADAPFKDIDLKDDGFDEEPPLDDRDDFFDDNMGADDFGGGGGVAPVEKHSDLLKDLTNFDPYLRETFNSWLAITWNEESNKFLKNPLLNPVMSVQGAAFCSGTLKTYTRRNNIITDIGKEEYKAIMLDHIESIWLNLGTRDDLGVCSDGDLIRVANELEHAASLVLMGADNGKYNRMLGTTYSHHTNANSSQNNGGMNNTPANGQKVGALDKMKKFLVGSKA